MHLDGTPGQRLGVYVADPGTPDHDALLLLDLTAPSATSPTTGAVDRPEPHAFGPAGTTSAFMRWKSTSWGLPPACPCAS